MITATTTKPPGLPRQLLRFGLVGLIMIAAGLRFRWLFQPEIHADEALFATWARLIGTWRAPLLRTEIVDKPPLLFYLQATMYPLFGSARIWVTRVPNLAASILVVPLTIRLVWQLYRDATSAAVVAILVTFSPLLIAFSSTSFTDPLLAALLTASLVFGTDGSDGARDNRGRMPFERRGVRFGFSMGLLMGLALATKYQALLFIPLQLGLGWLHRYSRREWRWWLAGLMLPLAGLIVWLLLRGGATDLWFQQMAHYGGLRMARSWELWPRLEAWGAHWAQLLDAPVLAFGFILFSPVFLAILIQKQDRRTAFDQLLLIFLIAYTLLHWFVAVPLWDRYLLPVVPLAAILLGRFIARIVAFGRPALPIRPGWVEAGVVLLVLALSAPASVAGTPSSIKSKAVMNALPRSEQIANELADAPYGTVMYDHWFSWQSRYALMDEKVYVSWFAHPDALVEDLDVFLDRGEFRYILLPRRVVAIPVIRSLDAAGYTMEVERIFPEMALYRIVKQ